MEWLIEWLIYQNFFYFEFIIYWQFSNFWVQKKKKNEKKYVDTIAGFPIFIQDTCGTLTFRLCLVWEGETELFTASIVFTTWAGHYNK